jgi:outer membrane protein assembly factor BamB
MLLADSWPQFRGPGSRGIAPDDPRLPVSWSSHDNVVWRVEIPGKGWSSPIAWNDRIFLQTNVSSSGDQAPGKGFYGGSQQYRAPSDEHRWIVYSIDFEQGRTRWATQVYKGVPKGPRHPKNSYASETLVTDGERVYAHCGDLATYCLDMAGKILWSKEWPLLETSFGYGAASSPALAEGRLYIVNDNEQQSYIVALDKLTGREIWRVNRDEPTTWSTPYIWKNEQRTEIVTAGRKKVRSYDLDGKLLWELSGMSALTIPTPFSDSGLLYVSSGYRGDRERPVYAIRPGASGDISLESGKTGNRYVAWSLPQGAPYIPSPLLYDGRFYTLLDQGFLTCNDAKTGAEIYGKQRLDPASANFTSSPWAYNQRIFCLNEDGDTYVVAAGPQFKVLGKNSVDEACLASPAVANGSLILRTFSKLYRIGQAA